MPVGEQIKKYMKLRNLSQNALAKAAGISQSGISSIVNGAVSPKENTLQAIADALYCSVSELIGEDGNNAQSRDLNISEIKMLELFRSLNTDGQDRLLEYAQDMAQLVKWTKEKAEKAV